MNTEKATRNLNCFFYEANRRLEGVGETTYFSYDDFEVIAAAQAIVHLEHKLENMVKLGVSSNIVEAAGDWSRDFQERLLQHPPRFNSTNAMSNAVEKIIFETQFEFAKTWCLY